MCRKRYPKTTEEAFEVIDNMLSDEEKKTALKTVDDDDFASCQHFGLGLWVRNNWIYGGHVGYDVLSGQSPLDWKPGEPSPIDALIMTTPDDLSQKFVRLYHKHLRETMG